MYVSDSRFIWIADFWNFLYAINSSFIAQDFAYEDTITGYLEGNEIMIILGSLFNSNLLNRHLVFQIFFSIIIIILVPKFYIIRLVLHFDLNVICFAM